MKRKLIQLDLLLALSRKVQWKLAVHCGDMCLVDREREQVLAPADEPGVTANNHQTLNGSDLLACFRVSKYYVVGNASGMRKPGGVKFPEGDRRRRPLFEILSDGAFAERPVRCKKGGSNEYRE